MGLDNTLFKDARPCSRSIQKNMFLFGLEKTRVLD